MQANPVRVLALVLAVTASATADLPAQERLVPFFGGGLAVGTGDLGQHTGTGWSIFGGVDLPTRVPGLTMGTTVSYARVPYEGGFDEREGITAIVGEVGYLIGAQEPWPVKPFLRAGAGLQVYRYDPGNIDTNASTLSRPGLSADAGLTLDLGGVQAFIGGRFLGDTNRGHLGLYGGLALR